MKVRRQLTRIYIYTYIKLKQNDKMYAWRQYKNYYKLWSMTRIK